MTLPQLTDDDVRRVPATVIVDALEAAVRDPGTGAHDPPRGVHDFPPGQLLLMPSWGERHAGVKIASVTPENPASGLPRIQGLYLLLDAATLTPVALVDAVELTALRTAAVSAVAVRHLLPQPAECVAILGSGVQAWSHMRVLHEDRLGVHFDVVGRDQAKTALLVDHAREHGIDVSAASRENLVDAELVVCCTTARTPVVQLSDVASDAVIVAVGSHEPNAAEIAIDLVARSTVVVETKAVAKREAGEVVQALAGGRIDAEDLVELGSLVRGEAKLDSAHPRIFKSVGMAWEDLVVASVVLEQHGQHR